MRRGTCWADVGNGRRTRGAVPRRTRPSLVVSIVVVVATVVGHPPVPVPNTGQERKVSSASRRRRAAAGRQNSSAAGPRPGKFSVHFPPPPLPSP